MLARTLAALVLVLGHMIGGGAAYDHVEWEEPIRRHRHGHSAGDNPRGVHHNDHHDVRYETKHFVPDCPSGCLLKVLNIHEVRSTFQDFIEELDTALVSFKLIIQGHNESILDEYPYMGNNFRSSEWVWASEKLGRKLLGLPLDADVLSLYILDGHRKHINVYLSTMPSNCLIRQSPGCRIYAVRKMLILNATYIERRKHTRDFMCHRVMNSSNPVLANDAHSHFVHRCCDIAEFRSGDHFCRIYTSYRREVTGVITVINVISVIFTLFSPIVIMKIKMTLKYDNVTKFFRASLKHGITGQRNYVIRICSRQLINLNDPKPFSIPRFLFRLMFHCYGEGRCCIHAWADWRHQPAACRRDSECRRCWPFFWRFFAIAIVYPIIFYIAAALYAPRLQLYASIVNFANELENYNPLYLNVNMVAAALLPMYNPGMAIWMLFSFVAFVYIVLLLSWPNNPLERCLLQMDTRRPYEHPHMLYDRMTRGYKQILRKLAYGDFKTKRHFFRIRWIPWGFRRLFHFIGRVCMQIPIFNICFGLTLVDNKMFKLRKEEESRDQDETKGDTECECISPGVLCKWICSLIIWLGFVAILGGYCTAVYIMTEFTLNVLFFTILGAVLHASTALPVIAFILVMIYYVNDTLAIINREHCEILKLIDENSPRISAVEDTDEVFRDGTIQILKTHNLGAVKFIDGDNTEYVSKELYYNVCADLKCGWSRSIRRIFVRLSIVVLFVMFTFLSLSALGAFTGSGVLVTVAAVLASFVPKAVDVYKTNRPARKDHKAIWAKVMPDILDRHIRVDRTQCVDETEEELTTYDVRPVGLLEMDVPRMVVARSLRLWKFPWIVSADQQTQSHESFIIALANKLAAASFLSKLVTRAYSPDLEDENILRQWCLLVENCILEGSATASSINGVPVESIRLFPRDVQPLVSPFTTGNTIDAVVDNINRELYGPFTKGVLVTIGNTTLAMCKMENTIFAFNSSCHGDQVTDLFGAVLIATDFNTQNLQTTIKFVVDPYAPDAVPVYGIVPIEGFVFKSANIIQLDVPLE